MFTTEEAVRFLLDNKHGLILRKIDNHNFHIFKCVTGLIYQGEIGGCNFSIFDMLKHQSDFWEIDYETSTIVE